MLATMEYTGERSTLHPKPCTEPAIESSAGKAGTHTMAEKRAWEDSDSEDKQPPRTSNPAAQETAQQDKDGDQADHRRHSEHCWPQGDGSKKSMDQYPAESSLSPRGRSASLILGGRHSDYEECEVESTAPSDQRPREAKSAPYRDVRYTKLLATNGSFMNEDNGGIAEKSMALVQNLLDQEQEVPQETLFRDDIFKMTLRKLKDKNVTRIIRDISLLIVPSAETLATYGANELDCLAECVNEGWNSSIPLSEPRPQPDYTVGFREAAFTEEQLAKLQPFVGDYDDQSYFMATWYIYFPFLTCEVMCGLTGLDVVDRQNTHSMTLAVRAVVELFRMVGREKEVDREILAFSISHDDKNVRIYGHYPVIEGEKTTFYRHSMAQFNLSNRNGQDKWLAYKCTKNIYRTWMPIHLQRICSVIDTMPADRLVELTREADVPSSTQGQKPWFCAEHAEHASSGIH